MPESFLLDTHSLLWFFSGSKSLSRQAREKISDISNICYFSIASLWEIAIKFHLDKLQLEIDFKDIAAHLADNNIEILQITFDHVLELVKLEDIHRDPFDRMIISQARTDQLTIISKDSNFPKYSGLDIFW